MAVATVLGNITGVDGVRDIAGSFYIANEGISILENLGKIGVPMPEKLKSILRFKSKMKYRFFFENISKRK